MKIKYQISNIDFVYIFIHKIIKISDKMISIFIKILQFLNYYFSYLYIIFTSFVKNTG